MEAAFKKLQHSNTIDDLKDACATFATSLDFDGFNVSIVFLSRLMRPPFRVISNLKNTHFSFHQVKILTQTCYLHVKPVVFNPSRKILHTIGKSNHRTPYAGMAFPIHTSGEYFILLSLHYNKHRFISTSNMDLASMHGELFARYLTEKLLAQLQTATNTNNQLNKREIQYLKQIASGEGHEEIARSENVASCTVAHHLLRAKRKLNAKTASQAITKSLLMGHLIPKF